MNELDKIIQSKLSNHEAEYSSDLWSKIDAQLSNVAVEKPKRLWWWMSAISGIVLVLGALSLMLWTAQESIPVTSTNDKAENTTSIEKPHGSSGQEVDSEASNMAFGSTSPQSDEWTLLQGNTDDNASVQYSPEVKQSSKPPSPAHMTLSASTVESRSGQQEIVDVNDMSVSQSLAESSYTVGAGYRLDEQKDMERTLTESKREAYRKTLSIKPLRTIGVSQYNTKLHSASNTAELELSDRLSAFRQDCPSFVTDRTGIYFDLYWSHEYGVSNFTAANQELEAYQILRESTESSTYSYSVGGRMTMMLPNGLGLKTGLNFSQYNERFNYLDPKSNDIQTVIIIDTIDGMVVRDTNRIVIPGSREISITNRYTSLDIPLLLSYEWDVRERMYMTVNGGIYLNLLFRESGKVITPGGEVIDLSASGGDNKSFYKDNVGLSLFGSVGLHYRWIKNIDLILEPNFRLLLKSATTTEYPLKHKWFTGGLITGVRYNF